MLTVLSIVGLYGVETTMPAPCHNKLETGSSKGNHYLALTREDGQPYTYADLTLLPRREIIARARARKRR